MLVYNLDHIQYDKYCVCSKVYNDATLSLYSVRLLYGGNLRYNNT